MYRHVLTLIDCTDEARRTAQAIARRFGPMETCRITLVAAMTPTPEGAEAIREKKVRHAQEALKGVGDILRGYGIPTRKRIVEGNDFAEAVAEESRDTVLPYDLIVLGAYQARPEDDELPCRGSLVDQISQRVSLPVMVVPTPPATISA